LDDLKAKEKFCFDRIEKYDPNFGPARLLRFVELHTRARFIKILEATDHSEAKNIKLPPFHKPSEKMLVNDMAWLPGLPNTGQNREAPTLMHTGEKLDDTSKWYH
jgi:hypothetical protein